MKISFLCCALFCAITLPALTPELVLIGDPENPAKNVPYRGKGSYPRGSVSYPYRIGKSEVSNTEYAKFLNTCATQTDPYRLWDEHMQIIRQGVPGNYRYVVATGKESEGVSYVSRVNAARYCNFLTSGSPEKGAYRIESKIRSNGQSYDAIVGFRDLTNSDTACVYYLPNMYEFFKAGFYEGNGSYREISAANREEPSHYGIVKHASGLREHMEDKVHAGVPFSLGASDSDTDGESMNTARFWPQAEHEGNAQTGFRIAATAPLQIGRHLNDKRNFFLNRSEQAMLKIRLDAPDRQETLAVELQNFAGETVWEKQITPKLARGVTTIPLELPSIDGYYELLVKPADQSFRTVIPLAIMVDPVDNGTTGNFGLTCHIARRERIFDFEEFDFNLLRQLGVSTVRVDVRFDDREGYWDVLPRIHEAGLRPLAILPGMGNYTIMTQRRLAHPELVKKWAEHDVAPDFAWYAEQVFQTVSRFKAIVRDWEIGNEPTFWNLLPEDYAQLLKSANKAAKIADPDCNIIAGDLSAIHSEFLRMRGGEFSDSLAIHIYGFYVPSFWGLAGKMRELNGWKQAVGVPDKPIWITETGACNYSSIHLIPVATLDEVRRYQALHMPKIMGGTMGLGADKIQPYNFRDLALDHLEEEFGMLDRYGFPKPAAASYRATAKLLGEATFRSFLKGHSFEVGKIAGFLFQDKQKRDVVLLWRNDLYGNDDFRKPFYEIIKPAETVRLKAAGNTVEHYNLSGGKSTLAVTNGFVEVPVSEYPVFVRGELSPETEAVPTAHKIPEWNFPAMEVRIRPNYPARACDLKSSRTVEITAGSPNTVTVKVYNLQKEPRTGVLHLRVRHRWNEWAWNVTPSAIPLTVPGDGMGEGTFTISVPKMDKNDFLFYMDATFGQWKDTVAFSVKPRQFSVKQWITYSRGYQLSQKSEDEIEISWQKSRDSIAGFTAKSAFPFAENQTEQECTFTLPIKPSGAEITAVNLLFRDATGDTYQLKQKVSLKPDQWNMVRFNTGDIHRAGAIIHRGGDGKIDYPVALHGFNFDVNLEKSSDSGSVLLKHYERTGQKELQTGGGGSVGMDE